MLDAPQAERLGRPRREPLLAKAASGKVAKELAVMRFRAYLWELIACRARDIPEGRRANPARRGSQRFHSHYFHSLLCAGT